MIPEEIYAPVMEFVSRAEEIPNLLCAILFGSAIQGEMGRKSDIDILLVFDTDYDPETREEAKIAIRVGGQIEKKYRLDYPFSFVVTSVCADDGLDPHFLWQVCREGTVIWGRPEPYLSEKLIRRLSPYLLVSYDMDGLTDETREVVAHTLFGSEIQGEGDARIIDGERGRQVGEGTFLLREDALSQTVELFERHGVRYSEVKLWG